MEYKHSILSDGGNWFESSPARCSSCDGLHPAEVIRLLRTDGTKFALDEWNDGWPHKFHIEVSATVTCRRCYEFYTIHLSDASKDEFSTLQTMLNRIFGVVWMDGKCFLSSSLRKKGPIWGEIVNGEPDFSAMNAVNGRKK